jgi:hypothetical protein
MSPLFAIEHILPYTAVMCTRNGHRVVSDEAAQERQENAAP